MSSAVRAVRKASGEAAPGDDAGPPPSGDPGSQLAREFSAAWSRGECSALEQFLAARPDMHLETAVAVRLVCEEIGLRQEAGETVDSAEILARFPQWQAELELLLACYGLFQDEPRTDFPASGEELGEFRLLAELGRGATGRVFLATQPSLSDRPVVVKCTSLEAAEHLSLSRLQHTGIVPLYLVQDLPERGLRALCMPYLGGASLDALLAALKDRPVVERSGRHVVEALGRLGVNSSAAAPFEGPALRRLEGLSYVQAVCWIGGCLADALHYAHQRGLVHLDLKPSNVLLAGDGQPMLLDFHLARSPVQPHPAVSDWLGGTPGYMSPEQAAAVAAIRSGSPVGAAVDERSDIYSLGVLLYEMLGGPAGAGGREAPPPLRACNASVSRGLADLIEKCLARAAPQRYADAASLADDLRRQLDDLPLRGVPNRSLSERWQKWRRRRPQALPRLASGMLVAAACGGAALTYMGRQARDAQADLQEAEKLLDRGEFSAALDRLRTGATRLAFVPGRADLRSALEGRFAVAQRRRLAEDLHQLVDQLRYYDSGFAFSPARLQEIDRTCGAIWRERGAILTEFPVTEGGAEEQEPRTELLDLAILWAELKVRSAAEGEQTRARRDALELLAEAEQTFGRSVVLDQERAGYAAEPGADARPAAREAAAPRSVWEHNVQGRRLLHSGRLAEAEAEFQQALDAEPQAFWPNYGAGVCAYRAERPADALTAFSVCVALEPASAECFYNRGLAYAALDRRDDALDDYTRALTLDPRLAAASLHRGMLFRDAGRFEEAAADFQRAIDDGAEACAVHYQWALLHLARNDRAAAKASLRAALAIDPDDRDSLALLRRLE